MKTITNKNNDGRLEAIAVITFFIILFLFTILASPVSGQVNGNSGHCLEFNGTTSGVTFANNDLGLSSGNTMTVTAWVKCNSTTNEGSWANIVTLDNSNSSASGDDGQFWLQHSQTNSTFEFAVEDVSNSRNYVESVTTPVTGQWYHVAGVYDGSFINIYVNGVLESRYGVSGKKINNFSHDYNLVLGQWANPGNSYRRFNGDIDEVTIWNIALTQTQIRTNMCKKLQGNEAGLVGYWRMNETSGNNIHDVTSNGNTGTGSNTSIVWSGAPIGDASTFTYGGSDISISNPAYGDSLAVNGFSSVPSGIQVYRIDTIPNYTTAPAGYAALATRYYYGVYVIGSTSPAYKVSYYYNGNTQISSSSNAALATRNDNSVTAWTDLSASLNIISKAFQKTGQSGRGEYIPALKSVLPISLLNFNATANGNEVNINWSTASEKDNHYFTVERTTDGVNYETIATLNGAGNSDQTIDYSAKDPNPIQGTSYYRLRQTDFDGNSETFKCVTVNFSGSIGTTSFEVQSIYPNPFRNNFSMNIECNKAGQLNIEILNTNGSLIDKNTTVCAEGSNTYEYSKGYILAAGIYFVRLTDQAGNQTITKIIKNQ
jgi:hypothetical protein